MESGFEDRRGHKPRERRCVASGEVMDPSAMIRFALSPDKIVTPDIAQKLPGRGVWVSADRASLTKAIETKAFARGFKSKAKTPDGLVEMVDTLLAKKVLGLLAMAMKAGQLHIGFDQVKAAAGAGPLAWRIEASDGSQDGRGKIRTLSRAVSLELEQKPPHIIGCFTGETLGEALGRVAWVHGALSPGRFAGSFTQAANRLRGFREFVPSHWPDKGHEKKED